VTRIGLLGSHRPAGVVKILRPRRAMLGSAPRPAELAPSDTDSLRGARGARPQSLPLTGTAAQVLPSRDSTSIELVGPQAARTFILRALRPASTVTANKPCSPSRAECTIGARGREPASRRGAAIR